MSEGRLLTGRGDGVWIPKIIHWTQGTSKTTRHLFDFGLNEN